MFQIESFSCSLNIEEMVRYSRKFQVIIMYQRCGLYPVVYSVI